ncbi:internalin-like protein [Lachnospiraceae bacterium KM106-2]|nr:internalin-like protein [Lachnospiraceae bacterium KM106-2]
MKKKYFIPIAIAACTIMTSCNISNNHDDRVAKQTKQPAEVTSQEENFSNKKLIKIIQNKIDKKKAKISKSDLEKIEELDLTGTNITDLNDIEKLPNLKTLDLSNTGITDLEPLSNLKQLEDLRLGLNEINSLTPIQNMISLKKLDLDNTYITDINPLNKLVNLEELNLRNSVELQDLTPLKNMVKLKILNINGCERIGEYQSNVKILESLKLLTTLRMQSTGIEKQMFLANLPNLKVLQADLEFNNKKLLNDLGIIELDTMISNDTDLSGLTGLKNLERLYILDGTLQEIPKPIGSLTKLTELVIIDRMGESTIANISCLKKLTQLEKLQIAGNNIKDLDPIKNLTQLKYLDLSNNRITDLSMLGNLINLEYLDLSDNSIEDVGVLKNMRHLKELNIKGNNILDTSGLKKLENETVITN